MATSKEKACKNCKTIFECAKCPKCGSDNMIDSFKGKIVVLKPEESEIAKNLKIADKGKFALKVK